MKNMVYCRKKKKLFREEESKTLKRERWEGIKYKMNVNKTI